MSRLALQDMPDRLALALVRLARPHPLQHLPGQPLARRGVEASVGLLRQVEAAVDLADQRTVDHRLAELLDQVESQAGLTGPVGVQEVIAVAHRCGALAVLAHPGRSKGIYAIPADDDDIAAMAAIGLDGVEVFYATHDAERRAYLRHVAERLGLLMSGGSDSHHPSQPLACVPDEDATILTRLDL